MKEEYIVAFSSFYKAAYAQEKLQNSGIKSKVGKLPTELIKSCGYALELENVDIDKIQQILYSNEITVSGIFKKNTSEGKNGKMEYIVVKNK